MKRTRVTFHCDVCFQEIEEANSQTDYHGRNYGLCEHCSCLFGLRLTPFGNGLLIKVQRLAERDAAEGGEA